MSIKLFKYSGESTAKVDKLLVTAIVFAVINSVIAVKCSGIFVITLAICLYNSPAFESSNFNAVVFSEQLEWSYGV